MPATDRRPLDAPLLRAWLADFARAVEAHADWLTDLDRRIGDADHGGNLHRGLQAVLALPEPDADARAYARSVAMTLISTVGGASGPLSGTFFLRFAAALEPDGPTSDAAWAAALRAGAEGVRARGKAHLGDKTLVDALLPAIEAFEAADADRWAAAVRAAEKGRDATADLVARRGRASYLGERSRGTIDPGSASAVLLWQSAARTLGA